MLSLERDLEEIKSKFAMHVNGNACGDGVCELCKFWSLEHFESIDWSESEQ